mgnify:FL=1
MRPIRLIIFAIFASAAMLLAFTAVTPETKAQACTTAPLDLMCPNGEYLQGVQNDGTKLCKTLASGVCDMKLFSEIGCSACPYGSSAGIDSMRFCRLKKEDGSVVEILSGRGAGVKRQNFQCASKNTGADQRFYFWSY